MMFANYKINLSMIDSGTTATTINIPLNLEFQLVDQAEVIEREFVKIEVEKSINPILDYDKTRFSPIDSSSNIINKITYSINLLGKTNYEEIGFTDNEIKLEFNSFKNTHLLLSFFDTDNQLTQRLITNVTLFSSLTQADLLPNGKPKSANEIGLTFIVENPIINSNGNIEGYFLYDYLDSLNIGESKYLYMRATFRNAKTGKAINLMVDNVPYPIDQLINKLYTRYILTRTTTGYYYRIDNSYNGDGIISPNNVTYMSNNVLINLYQINTI